MKHSPIDIEQQEFSSAWRGINAREVKEFLHSVARDLADVSRRNTELRAELGAQTRLNEQMQAREDQVKEALVLAQRTVEDLRTQATREAEIKLAEARAEAQRIVADAEGRHTYLTGQLGELTRQRVRLMEELRGLLATHGRLLDVHAAEVSRQVPRHEAKPPAKAARGVLDFIDAPLPPGLGQPHAPQPPQRAAERQAHGHSPEAPRARERRAPSS